jgi:EAL domain-containing protein (putative c-di-GMP-specific phosphodiesterase class I)
MTLVRGIDRDATRQKLVASLAAVCRDLGMQVVTEGVETPGERDMVAELGCELLQGYLFAKPSAPFCEVKW